MKDTLKIGSAMWLYLFPAFKETMKEFGVVDHKERAQVWAAFIAAATGSMVMDLGKADAMTVLDGVLAATNETRHLVAVSNTDAR